MALMLAVPAALALALLDCVVIVVCYMYRPAGAEYFAAAMLAGALASVVLRWRWLLLATQNAVTGLVLARVIEGWDTLTTRDVPSLFTFAALLALGNLLAWLVARALRRPPVRLVRHGPR